jgi:hypothetical protein
VRVRAGVATSGADGKPWQVRSPGDVVAIAQRIVISLPAGYARMRPVRFGIYTAAGCVPWIGGLAWAAKRPGLTGSACSTW